MARTNSLLIIIAAAVGFAGLTWLSWNRFKTSESTVQHDLDIALDDFSIDIGSTGASSADVLPSTVASPYVGISSCKECHADRVEQYLDTSHAHSFQSAEDGVPGTFEPDKNELKTRVPDLRYKMTHNDEGYYQSSIEEFPLSTRKRQQRIELVMGSGKYAHAYMYWDGNRLFQMPVAFFTPIGVWVNPPGFSDRWAWWNRPMTPRCLECHATYFDHIPGSANAYQRGEEILAISCERCHGPARNHVRHHRQNPNEAVGADIVAPAELSRMRQIELCGQCHGTVGKPLQPSFTYRPGEPLDEYLAADETDEGAFVHAVNQVQRLSLSKCFQNSEMTCTTCHDPHSHERGQIVTFSQRCQQCHEPQGCPQHRILGSAIAANCVDCHMPERDDQSLPFNLPEFDKLKLISMREHNVAIYPEDAERTLARWPRDAMPPDVLSQQERATARRVREALQRAELWLAINEPANAIEALQPVAENGNANVLSMLGRLRVDLGDYESAQSWLDEALTVEPGDAATWYYRAVAAHATGQLDVAVDAYYEALRLDPENRLAKRRLAWLLATGDVDGFRDGELAVELAQSLTDENPDDWQAWDTLAAAYAESGSYFQAMSAIRRAVELAPESEDEIEQELEDRRRLYQGRKPYRESKLIP